MPSRVRSPLGRTSQLGLDQAQVSDFLWRPLLPEARPLGFAFVLFFYFVLFSLDTSPWHVFIYFLIKVRSNALVLCLPNERCSPRDSPTFQL